MKIPAQLSSSPVYASRALRLAATLSLLSSLPLAADDVSFRPLARLGLTDAEHTSQDGVHTSALWQMTDTGTLAGTSTRYLGAPAGQPRGVSTWLADASGRLLQVGFDDVTHTVASTGGQTSSFVDISAQGVAIGYTDRADGGRTAWRASLSGGTIRLGLYDGIHASRRSGGPYSEVLDVNAHGYAVGYSARSDGGSTAWIAAPNGALTVVAITAPPDSSYSYVSPTGVAHGAATEINDDGYVLGSTMRYYGSEELETAWRRSPDGSMEYFEYANTHVHGLTESGYFALRFGSLDRGVSVNHVSGTSRQTGFYSGETYNNGIALLNESGTALGTYSVAYQRGYDTWISSDVNGLHMTGLLEYPYRDFWGEGATFAGLNSSGTAAGTSPGYDGVRAAWVGDETGAVQRIGLYGGIYYGTLFTEDRERGHASFADGLNEAGVVWGHSERLHGDYVAEGQTAWLYKVSTGTYTILSPSVRAADDYSFTAINHVLDSGIAYGTYTRFGHADQELGPRALIWTQDHGVLDVDQNSTTPVAEAGWDHFSSVEAGSSTGLFAGHGRPRNDHVASQAVFVVQMTDEPPAPPSDPTIHYIGRLGFYDGCHQDSSGYRNSHIAGFASSGYSIGTSQLFTGADDVPASSGRVGQTAWLGTAAGSTSRLGFYDSLHTRDDGRQENTPVAVNDQGVSIGYASRFAGHEYRGDSAWVADRHGNVLKIGFYDAAHTGADGTKISRPVALNGANSLIGYSLHPDTFATSAWLSNSVGRIERIGLFDAAHTAPDGTRVSVPIALNDAGYVVGTSEFYVPGASQTGLTAWLRQRDGVMRRVGFEAGVHRAQNGLHESTVDFLNNTSRLAGTSVRYHLGANNKAGRTAWVTHVDGPNKPVGFYTGRHAGPNNIALSAVVSLNDAGFAIGYSSQFSPSSTGPGDDSGRSAWIARPDGTTVRVGIYDAAHSRGEFQYNTARRQDNASGVAGTADRYVSGSYRGHDAWVADDSGVTRRIGLIDTRHVRSDLYRASTPGPMNASFLGGTSARFNGAADAGQTAWVYNRSSGSLETIELSVRASDGYAHARITHLLDSGLARGVFRKFDSSGNSLGDRAFVYIPGAGARELGYAVDITLQDEGWRLLGAPSFSTENGFIAGDGLLLGYGPGSAPRQFAHGVYLVQE